MKGVHFLAKSQEKGYHHGDLKVALVTTARRFVEKEGWASLNLRDLAREVGVSHMAPYRHFKDKTELLASVGAEGFLILNTELHQALKDEFPTLRPAIAALFKAYVRFARKHPLLFSLMFSPELSDRQRFPELDESAKSAGEMLVSLIRTRQDKRQIRTEDALLLRVAALSMAHGTATLLTNNHLSRKEIADLGVDKMIEANIDVLVRGLEN